jgi:hypothetical protein
VARNVTDFGETEVVVADGQVQVRWLLHGATCPAYSVGLVILTSLTSLLVAVPPPGPVPPGLVMRFEPTIVVWVTVGASPTDGVAVSVTRR